MLETNAVLDQMCPNGKSRHAQIIWVAGRLGISPSAIYQWGPLVPRTQWWAIHEATKGELRPL